MRVSWLQELFETLGLSGPGKFDLSNMEHLSYRQLGTLALAKASAGQAVYYGVIDGDDLNQLYQAYRKQFK